MSESERSALTYRFPTGVVEELKVSEDSEPEVEAVEDENDPEPSFKDEISDLVHVRRMEVVTALKKWIRYWADFGKETLILEDCPHLWSSDLKLAREWLKSEGFELKVPRFWGKGTIIKLTRK